MEVKKYAAQKKHIKEHYYRWSIDIRKEKMALFREICEKVGTRPTTVVQRAVDEFIAQNSKDVS